MKHVRSRIRGGMLCIEGLGSSSGLAKLQYPAYSLDEGLSGHRCRVFSADLLSQASVLFYKLHSATCCSHSSRATSAGDCDHLDSLTFSKLLPPETGKPNVLHRIDFNKIKTNMRDASKSESLCE